MVNAAQEEMLTALDDAVTQITDFLAQVDDNFYDGYQTAREVLSHLVFWQREYVVITEALVNGRSPHLRQSTFVALNARSVREYRQRSLTVLCHDFLKLQQTFTENLQKLPDWEIEFPIKKGCRRTSVAERLPMILEHIDGHLTRLKNAQRHGEAWVNAYYPTRNHAHN